MERPTQKLGQHFVNKRSESPNGGVTCPKSDSRARTELGFPVSLDNLREHHSFILQDELYPRRLAIWRTFTPRQSLNNRMKVNLSGVVGHSFCLASKGIAKFLPSRV